MFYKLYQKIRLFLLYLSGHKRQVAAAVIEKNSKILIAKRRSGDTLGGKWEFPGGKIEPGETPEECLTRELKEEFDVETEVEGFLLSTTFRYFLIPIELLAYKVKHISGEFKANEHDEIMWVSPNEFDSYDLVNADKPIAKVILEAKNTGYKT
ncbi:MAG: (deoxy)nucleoside triphosphate pyrophosphohydrolase [Candidatus Omnitrophota bacterium]|nr:(deoxy)nucleoside triphosphate pyrophosphohydrolase [Candidatus Omnitrophota bacterium]